MRVSDFSTLWTPKLDSVGGSYNGQLSCLQRPCLASSLSHSKLWPPLLHHGSKVRPPTLLLHCWGLRVYLICHPILLQVILHSLIPTILPLKPLLQHWKTLMLS